MKHDSVHGHSRWLAVCPSMASVAVIMTVGFASIALADITDAQWIVVDGAPTVQLPQAKRTRRAADGTSWFAKDFVPRMSVRRVIWQVSSLGVFEAYLNGQVIGDDVVLKPGYTDALKTRYYFTYDVTDLLTEGTNTLAAEVSHGWWSDAVVNFLGPTPAFRGSLIVEYRDGSIDEIRTDSTWRAAVAGAVTHAGIFDGEEYDARIVQPVKGGDWPSAVEYTNNTARLYASRGAEVVRRSDLEVKRGPFKLAKGERLVVDFGQNMAGVPEFVFRAARGVRLRALPAEMLNDAARGERGCDDDEGTIYRANLRCPKNGMRVEYVFAGNGKERYRPRFTYFGFRYLELSADGEVEIVSVTAVPLSSVKPEQEIGFVRTGDAAVNQLISNIYWGQLSNYLSIPTDCPQRDERQGWTADAQVFAEAGSFNADTVDFFRKWLRDLRDSQCESGAWPCVAPAGRYGRDAMRFGWQDAGVIIPYMIWKQFSNRTIIDENWEAMDRFLDHLTATKMDFDTIRGECRDYQYADWLSLEAYESHGGGAFLGNSRSKDRTVRPEAKVYWNYLGAVYWLWDAQLMAAMAKGTGRDAAKYEQVAAAAKDYLMAHFFNTADSTLLPYLAKLQTANLFALKFNLVEGAAKTNTIELLKRNFREHGGSLATGFLGTSILLDTLTENGMADVAWNILLSHDYPGWLYSVDQGATTVWERWNSYTHERGFGPVAMNSFNHYAYGTVLAWIYRTAAGIAATDEDPGFKTIIMKPIPDRRLGHLEAEYQSAAGLIRSAWRYEGERWIWTFTIPEGAKALVTPPGSTSPRTYTAGTYMIEQR